MRESLVKANELKARAKTLSSERKKYRRRMKYLRSKSKAIDLNSLMEVLMMKAYVLNGEHEKMSDVQTPEGAVPWMPRNPLEAVKRIMDIQAASNTCGSGASTAASTSPSDSLLACANKKE